MHGGCRVALLPRTHCSLPCVPCAVCRVPRGIMPPVRHPAVSCVFYVSGDGTSPTVVTNESVHGDKDATTAYRCDPSENRLLMFPGDLLHGVIPARPIPSSNARITLMLGFWPRDMPPATTGMPTRLEHLGPNMLTPLPGSRQAQSKLRWRRKIHNLHTNPRWPTLVVEPIPGLSAALASSEATAKAHPTPVATNLHTVSKPRTMLQEKQHCMHELNLPVGIWDSRTCISHLTRRHLSSAHWRVALYARIAWSFSATPTSGTHSRTALDTGLYYVFLGHCVFSNNPHRC